MNMPGPRDAERRGGVRAQFSRNAAAFYTLFTHFLPTKDVKERLLSSINERNDLLHCSGRILLQIGLYSTLHSRYGWKCASSLQTCPSACIPWPRGGGKGGSSGSIQPERCVLLRSFYTLFAQKQRKRTTFAFFKQTQWSFPFFRPDSITNMPV